MSHFIIQFSPQWFNGLDILFESFSIIASLLIAFYALRLYNYSKDSKHKYFGLSFLAIALSFVFKIIANNIEVLTPVSKEPTAGLIALIYPIFNLYILPIVASLFIHRFLMLCGLFGIFYIVSKSKERNKIPLFLYFAFIITLFSTYSYHVFYFTAAFLSAFILRYYYSAFKKNKNKKTLLVVKSFLLILLGQFIFTLTFININFFVFAEIVQFLGFLILLYNYYLLQK